MADGRHSTSPSAGARGGRSGLGGHRRGRSQQAGHGAGENDAGQEAGDDCSVEREPPAQAVLDGFDLPASHSPISALIAARGTLTISSIMICETPLSPVRAGLGFSRWPRRRMT
jgi:hypothetical protein